MAGAVVGTTADMNGDDKSEILIGTVDSTKGGAKSGAAFVVFGKSTGTAIDLTKLLPELEAIDVFTDLANTTLATRALT